MEKTLAQHLEDRREVISRTIKDDRENLAVLFERTAVRFGDLAHTARTQPDEDVAEHFRSVVVSLQEDFYYAHACVRSGAVRVDELGFVISEVERYEHDHESTLPDTEPVIHTLESVIERIKALR